MISEAAIHHAGAALISRFFIEAELATGSLVRLFDLSLRQPTAYYFVYPEGRTMRPVVAAFRQRLMEEARAARPGREADLAG